MSAATPLERANHGQMTFIPPIVQERLEEMVVASDEVYALHRLATDDLREMSAERRVRIRELQDLCDKSHGNRNPFDVMQGIKRVREIAEVDQYVRQALIQFDAIDAKVSRRQSVSRPLAQKRESITGLVQNLRGYIDNVSTDVWIVPLQFEIQQRPAGDYGKQVAKLRETISTLAADARRIESAPFPSSHAKEIARRNVDQLAKVGRPHVSSLIEGGDEIRWPRSWGSAPSLEGVSYGMDPVATLAWLFRDRMIEALEQEIDAVSDDANAIGGADRARQIASLAEKRLTAERDEENLIRSAQAAGIDILRRGDVDPRAVLGFDLEPR